MEEETKIKSIAIVTAQGIQKFTNVDYIIEKYYYYTENKTIERYHVCDMDYAILWEIRCIDNIVIEYEVEK